MNKKTTAALAVGAALAITLTGCSSKASSSGSSGTGGSGDLQTDFGVTDDTITLGIQTDTSSVFKAVGLALTQGNQIWADKVNADGGICNRQIEFNIQDHQYKPDNAIPLFNSQKDQVVGFVQLLGSPIIAALKTRIGQDQVMSMIATQSSVLLDSDYLMMIGNSYDVEMINGLSWAMEEGMLKSGDKIAHLYVDSEYGQNGLLGAEYFAKENNIEVVKVPMSASDTDMTATMTKLKGEGLALIALTTAPAATASVALQNVQQGLNLPLIGNNPVFADALLADAAVTSALENLHVLSGGEPFAGISDLNKEIQDEFAKKYPNEPAGYGVPAGYLEGMVWEAILNQACEDGDMTRDGILKARLAVDNIPAEGLSGDMDLTDPANAPTRESFVFKIDKDAPGGEVVEAGPVIYPATESYKTPHQK